MRNADHLMTHLMASLLVVEPSLVTTVEKLCAVLAPAERAQVYRQILSANPEALAEEMAAPGLQVMLADEVLNTHWPEAIWSVIDLLPVGLTILAGAPKVGKSWLSLQLAQAIATGSDFLGCPVLPGPVLVCALEDPPRRLKRRMQAMKWPAQAQVGFITLPAARGVPLRILDDGAEQLAELIRAGGYRLVVIDTLSRGLSGDQLDVQVMTRSLTPLQELAHSLNVAIILCDHHRKPGGLSPDAIADILGSTAKGAMADTIWSLYRERGKSGAHLSITGRDVEEQVIDIEFDMPSHCWKLADPKRLAMTERRREIIDTLRTLGKATNKAISDAIGQSVGHTHDRLQDMVKAGMVIRIEEGGVIRYEIR